MEPIVAYLHYLGMIGVGVILSTELVLFQKEMSPKQAKALQSVDLLYLFAALLMIGTGLARVFWLAKGHRYYFSNLFFYFKITTFGAIGGISVVPTLYYLKWSGALKKNQTIQVETRDFLKIRRLILIQLILFPLIPLFAVLMVRGFGTIGFLPAG
jgi:putative membrane protein